MASEKMMMPRRIFLSSRMPMNLGAASSKAGSMSLLGHDRADTCRARRAETHLRIVLTPTLRSSE